jgi:hypothetical protein
MMKEEESPEPICQEWVETIKNRGERRRAVGYREHIVHHFFSVKRCMRSRERERGALVVFACLCR